MPQNSANQSLQKQPLNVYTVMLIVSFFALLIGTILLYLEGSNYGSLPWWKA
ncbi:MAG: hypothetical protein ABGX22_14940 [Pirellulaceae bacterium]